MNPDENDNVRFLRTIVPGSILLFSANKPATASKMTYYPIFYNKGSYTIHEYCFTDDFATVISVNHDSRDNWTLFSVMHNRFPWTLGDLLLSHNVRHDEFIKVFN